MRNEVVIMKNSGTCPKCGGKAIVRVPDSPRRHASGNNIDTTQATLFGKVPVIRYVCCDCGYVENWVEGGVNLRKLQEAFG